MDLSDINKVSNRKRINADAERLKEKVTRETAKIIKLKVAQDTAAWEAREQRVESERARERMQKDALDANLENERLAARLRDELRLRPDTLNKVDTAHKLSDELERNTERTRAAMRRAAADRVELEAAYARAAATVDAAAEEARARDQRLTQGAARAVRLAKRAAAETAGARAQLAAATAEAERERDRCEAQGAELVRRDAALLEAERAAAALRGELQLATAARADAAAELERGAREAAALRAALEGAEARAGEEERRRRELAAVVAGLERELSAVGERDKELANETREFALIEEKDALEEERNTLREQRNELAENSNKLQEEINNLSLEKEVLQKELLRARGAVERLMRELHARAVRSEEHAPPAAPRDPPGHEERTPPAPSLALAPARARPSFIRADSLLEDFYDSDSSMELKDVSRALRTPPGAESVEEAAPRPRRFFKTRRPEREARND